MNNFADRIIDIKYFKLHLEFSENKSGMKIVKVKVKAF